MVQVARVVADLVDKGRHLGRQPVILLEVDRKVGCDAVADGGQGAGILAAADTGER